MNSGVPVFEYKYLIGLKIMINGYDSRYPIFGISYDTKLVEAGTFCMPHAR